MAEIDRLRKEKGEMAVPPISIPINTPINTDNEIVEPEK